MSSKAKCKYWEKCYRKDATHLAEFLHPSDVKESKKEEKGSHISWSLFQPSVAKMLGLQLGVYFNTGENS